MLKNYLKIAIRNIKRSKVYSFINITGLAIGMACFLLIMLWVMDELSYDRFHENADHIYRVEQDQYYSGSVFHVNVTPYPMARGLKDEIPEVKYATPYPYMGTLLLRYEEKSFFEGGVRAVSEDFLQMFTFPLLHGDKVSVLKDPHALVITQEMAEKYFGIEDPVGKTVTINNRFDFTVSGVLENIPINSVVRFDMLVPFEFLQDLGRTIDQWGWNSVVTYTQLHEKSDVDVVNEKITDLRWRKTLALLEDEDDIEAHKTGKKTPFMLRPLADIHLHSYFGYNLSMGEILYVYIFSIVAVFILLLASINFMNLATARSVNRAKEVGMRKVVGAKKQNLIAQFFGESILMAFISLIFALILVSFLLQGFSELADKQFTLTDLLTWQFILGMIAVTLITGIVSGSYPAMFLSTFQPIKIIRGKLGSDRKTSLFRKVLVVFQFSISLILIISTIFVYNQLMFMKEKELGYDKEHLIYLPLRGDSRNSYDVLKQRLLQDERISNISGTNHNPVHIGSNSSGIDWDGKDPDLKLLVSTGSVDFDYAETMGIKLLEGRTFSEQFSTDTSAAFMINEALMKIMGVQSAANKRLKFGNEGVIVGVMKDYHFQSVQNNIEPLAIHINRKRINYMLIRLAAGNMQESLDFVKDTWNQIVPNYPFDHRFVDEEIERQYSGWGRMSSLIRYLAVLAIVIACLGLFGLASFMAEQRTKEIGVRKVLGASVSSLMVLMSRDFTKWVLLANIIAWPVAWYVMKLWLADFAYRIDIGIGTFILAGFLALLIALLTVLYQSIKTAMANPVEALRCE